MDSKTVLVRSLYDAYENGNTAFIAKAMAPGGTWHSGGDATSYPAFGVHKGPAGVEDFFAKIKSLLDFLVFSPDRFYAVDDKVFVLGHYEMTVKANGKKVASDFVHIFTVKDGKIEAFREFLDTAALIDAHRGGVYAAPQAKNGCC